METVIEVKNLSKQFNKIPVLKNVNLTLNKGECIALIGPNACGKTTLIKSILGMVLPTQGEIFFQGKTIKQDNLYRNHIGYMPQIGKYPENMTINQVIEMIKDIRPWITTYDEDLITQFQLQAMAFKKMRTLSGGTTQKVSAAIAFLFNPDVLILDEPTAGLDPLAADILKEKIIRERNNGKLILITSHLLSELDELISEVIFMQEGNIIFHQKTQELREQTQESKISKAISVILQKNNP
ncbi:MAG: ABC transporter ATP-binding protein [Bacteroidia bacterium]|nr:ABC transporter ATP-binding protein [Bacteroidia bacterium]